MKYVFIVIFILFGNQLLFSQNASSIFLRYKNSQKCQQLETAIIRYKNKDNLVVDLVSVIHIADKDYYKKINKLLAVYEIVLFELVKPEKLKIAQINYNDKDYSKIQNMFRLLFNLEHQMKHIQYEKKNFVHADISSETLLLLQKQYNRNLSSMMNNVSKEYMKYYQKKNQQPPQLSLPVILGFLLQKNSSRELKKWFAPQLVEIIKIMSGKEHGVAPILLLKRNQQAIKTLRKIILQGNKKIAIFYGAAHMPHFEKVLINLYKFVKEETIWLPAWKLSDNCQKKIIND